MADIRNALHNFIQQSNPEWAATDVARQQNALKLQNDQLTYQKNLSAQDLQHVKFGGQLAQALKAMPADQRPSVYAQYAPILKRNPNFDAQDEALFQTDQGLDQIINSSKFMTKPETYKLGSNERLYESGTNRLIAQGYQEPDYKPEELALRRLQIKQQSDLTRAQQQATSDYKNLSLLLQDQKMQQDQDNADRTYKQTERRLATQEAQQQAQINKAVVAKNKTLLPYQEAIASIQNTMDAANKLIFDPKRPGEVDPAFAGATGAIDKYTGTIGEMFGTKEGVKSRDIERFVNSKVIPLAESLKPLSNSDIAFIKTTFPSKGSSVKTWLSWYQNELPSIMKLAQDKMNAAASAYDITAPAGVYEGSNIPAAQNPSPSNIDNIVRKHLGN